MRRLVKYIAFAMALVLASCDFSFGNGSVSIDTSIISTLPNSNSTIEPSIIEETSQEPSIVLPSVEESVKPSENKSAESLSPSALPPSSVSVSTSTSTSTSTSITPVLDDEWLYDNLDNYYNYNELSKLTGAALKTKLFETISNHETISYKGLSEAYRTTDLRPDGTVWDMYGDFNFSLSGNACGNYKNEGDCWNKEHSMPKSWFNDASPMYSDIYHLFPTDGKINGMRSNNPYGEVGSATYTYITQNASRTGLTLTNKLGSSSYPGYSGVVFEPDDMYKGDFARAYFYMVTAYEDRVANWKTGDTNLGGTKYPGLNGWSTELLLKWSIEDPISQKEIDRTNEAYLLQKNRNPYTDNHSLVCKVFGPYNDKTKAMCQSVLEETKVTGVTINEQDVTLKTGENYQFHANVMPSNASDKKVTWSVNDTNVGTIDENGLFVAKQAGQVVITVTTNDGAFKATCNVTVEYIPPTRVTGVYLTEKEIDLTQNETKKIVVNVIPSNATNKHCTFESDNEDVAEVNEDGLIKAKNQGSATITVTTSDGGFTDSCLVRVTKLDKESTTIDTAILSGNVVDGYEYVVGGTVKEVSGAVYISKGGFLYNSTSLGNIKKIEITYASGGSAAAVQSYSFANTAIVTKPENADVILETSTGGKTAEIIPPTPGNGFFRIDVSGKNLQFTKIVIYL